MKNKDELKKLFDEASAPEQLKSIIQDDELLREAIRAHRLPDELQLQRVTKSARMQLLLSEQTKARLEEVAESLGISKNEAVNRAVRLWLRVYEDIRRS